MSDHQDFQATASELLQENGRSVTLSLKITSVGAKPWAPGPNAVINLPVIALMFPTVLKDDKGTVIPGEFQTATIASTDIDDAYQAWLETNAPSAVGDPTPKLTSKSTITDDNREFRILRIKEVKPGDQSILYEIIVAG